MAPIQAQSGQGPYTGIDHSSYEACEPSSTTRGPGNVIYSSTFGACVAAIPAGLDGQEFQFVDTSPGAQETVLRIGTESVTFTISE